MINIINCTPHPINIVSHGEIKPSGIIPRVSTTEVEAGNIEGIPCVTQSRGVVTGMPEPEKDTIFIVSGFVFNATDRKDVVAPDTGKTAIRNEKGHIIAVTRFIVK